MKENVQNSEVKKTSIVRKLLWRSIMLLLAIFVLFVIYAMTNSGTNRIVRYVTTNLLPLNAAQIDYDSVSGNPFSNLTLTGVRLTSNSGVALIETDSLSIAYDLPSLVSDHLEFKSIRLVRPILRIQQNPGGEWDIQNIFVSDPNATPPDVTIRKLDIEQGTLIAIPLIAPPNESITARSLNLSSRDIALGSRFALTSDHLSSSVRSWTTPEPVDMYASGRISDSVLSIDSLSIRSDRSDMQARGVLDAGTVLTPTDAVTNLTLDARPLHLGDVTALFPRVDPTIVVDANMAIIANAPHVDIDAHASFSDGSTMDLTGKIEESPSGNRLYSLDGELSSVRLSTFDSNQSREPLSATLGGQLAGSSLDSVSGSANIVSTLPFTYEGFAFLPSTISTTFVQGEATLDAQINTPSGGLTVEGTLRPFDAKPRYDLIAVAASVPVHSFVSEISGPVSGTVTARGVGISRETIDADVAVLLKQFEINRLNVLQTQVVANIREGRVRVKGSAKTVDGGITTKGSVRLGPDMLVEVEEAVLSRFDFVALTGDTKRSSLTGTGTGTFRFESTISDFAGEFRADSIIYGELAFDELAARVSSVANLVNGSATAIFNGSSIKAAAVARQTDSGFSLRNASAEFRNFDITQFTSEIDSTMLSGQLDVDVLSARSNVADWTLRLDSSSVNKIIIRQAEARGQYRADSTTFIGSVFSSEGDISAAGVVQLDGLVPTRLNVQSMEFSSLDPMAIVSSSSLTTNLNGTLTSIISLPDISKRTAVDLELLSSSINGIAVDGARLEVDLTAGVGPVTGSATFGTGSLQLISEVDISGEAPHYSIESRLVDAPIARLFFADTLSSSVTAELTLEGFASSIANSDLSLSLASQQSHYGAAQLYSLDALGSLKNGVLTIDSGEIESNVLRASATGSLALWSEASSSSFELVSTILDARPINAFLKRDFDVIGNGILYATVSGERGSESISIDTDLQSIVYGDMRAGGITAAVSGEINDALSFESLVSNIAVEHFSTPSITVRRTDFDVDLSDDTLTFDVFMTIDNRRNGSFNGTLDIGDDDRLILIEDLSLNFDADEWELLQPATIAYQDFYEVRNLLIFTDDQQIALDGVIDLDGDQSLLLTVEEFRMGAVADLLGFSGLDGTVNGYLDLTGPAQSPVVQGDLLSTVESFGKSYGNLSLGLAYDSLKLNLDAVLTNEDGSTFTVDGHIPVNLSLAPSEGQTESGIRVAAAQAQLNTTVDLDVQSDGFSLDWILPFLDPEVYSDIGGRVTGDVNVTGTVSDPNMDGEATLSDGHIGLVYFGLVYTDIAGELAFDGQAINLEHVEVRSGGGELIAIGTVNLSQLNLGKFDIALSAENFLAVDNDQYKGSVVADMNLSGTTNEPYISGYTKVVRGEMFLTAEYEDFEAVSLSQDDLLEVERVFGIRVTESDTSTFDFYKALALDIDVELERNMWLRSDASPEMDIQFTGDLDMRKVKDQDMQIFGNIEVIPERSRITELGKRFRIVNGALTFNGPATDPELNIEAHHTIRSSRTGSEDVTIILVVKGKLDDLEEAPLGSDPEMELADILSYLAFGRPARETLQFSGAGSENLAKDIALGQATGYLEGLAGSELGFDVFEIEQRDFETRLTAGKYLTQRLFVSVSQPISFSGQASELTNENIREITAEFELIQNLLLKLTQRESLKFNLLWQYAY